MGFGAPFLTDPAGAGVAPRLDQRREGSSDPTVSAFVSVQQTQPRCWLTGTMRVWLGWGTSQERNEWEVLGSLAHSFPWAWPSTGCSTRHQLSDVLRASRVPGILFRAACFPVITGSQPPVMVCVGVKITSPGKEWAGRSGVICATPYSLFPGLSTPCSKPSSD